MVRFTHGSLGSGSSSISFSDNIKGGIATASGDGTDKTFIIVHGLSAGTPTNVSVDDASVDAIGSRVVTWDGTNITLTYQVAPPLGTSNLSWTWTAIRVI